MNAGRAHRLKLIAQRAARIARFGPSPTKDTTNPRFWQFVWFFSMDEPAQATLIGPVESHWFIEEDEKNAGANYLIGVCLAFFEIAPPSSNPELAPEIQRLRHLVQRLSEDLVPRHWAFRSLEQGGVEAGTGACRRLVTPLGNDGTPAAQAF